MRERTASAPPLDLPGHSAPPVGFEVPLEMLAACHGRVQAQCATLQRLAAHLASQGADRQAQDAAAAVMRYFDTSAVHHHADEELDLFPALIESMAGSDAVCVRELTASLVAEHRELEQRWRNLHRRLEQVTRAEAATLPDDEVRGFIELYERHIAREEAELLPMAGRLLSDAELDRIGLAMRARRGAIEPTQPPIPPLPDAVRRAPSLIRQGVVMSQAHLHLSPDAIYPFDARGVAKRFRHAAIFGALDSLQAGETMRFANDHDPLPLLSQIAQRYGDRISVEYRQREPGAIVIDFSVH